jgi:hypothetical protein
MAKGETIMPVPQGVISTSTGPVDPNESKLEEAIKEADAEVAVEEFTLEEEVIEE